MHDNALGKRRQLAYERIVAAVGHEPSKMLVKDSRASHRELAIFEALTEQAEQVKELREAQEVENVDGEAG